MTATIQLNGVSKFFGNIIALKDISFEAHKGEVTALLGDNGAGKSTLIKCLSGVHVPDEGEIIIEGKPVKFSSPRQAAAAGIGTVYQDLALQPLMSVSRNFFLGREINKGLFLDLDKMSEITRQEMAKLGIDVADPNQPIGTLSGGQRQTLAISRAIYFGAKVLILDEPTSALGQKQQLEVLRTINEVRNRKDIAIIFITHNDLHARLIGDRFTFLNRGRILADGNREDIDTNNLRSLMAGGAELAELQAELKKLICFKSGFRWLAVNAHQADRLKYLLSVAMKKLFIWAISLISFVVVAGVFIWFVNPLDIRDRVLVNQIVKMRVAPERLNNPKKPS